MNTLKLLLLSIWLWLPVPCLGQQPAKAADVGTLPERHGIAVFGARSHHLDLAMGLLGGQDPGVAPQGVNRGQDGPEDQKGPSEPVKRLRAELHLRPEQLDKLMMCLGKAVVPLEKDKEGADPFKAFDAMEDLVLAQFSKVLGHKQQARFEELGCQFAGPMALRLKHYASRLELSVDQRRKIGDLVDAYTDKAADLQRAGFAVQSARGEKKLKALARELDEKILALLTDKQRAKWTKSLGHKFDWTGMIDG